jgi:hypothetical protein
LRQDKQSVNRILAFPAVCMFEMMSGPAADCRIRSCCEDRPTEDGNARRQIARSFIGRQDHGLIYGCPGLICASLAVLFGPIGGFAGPDKSPVGFIFGIVFAISCPSWMG